MVALTKPDNRIEKMLPIDQVLHRDCLEVLKSLPSDSLDACVVDPPYGLGEVKDIAGLLTAWIHDKDDIPYIGKSGFMGKEWDAGVPSPRYWREVYRVLKPGAHILCFAGTRTADLMTISLRLAGFQCRDILMWLHGQGFPKSLNISKAIDQHLQAERKVIGIAKGTGMSSLGVMHDDEWQPQGANLPITEPATEESRKYAGYGSALKPAHEPIILARKPLSEKSIAENVLHWGTGGINIDQCRVGLEGMEHHRTAGSGAIGTQHGIYGKANEALSSKQVARAEQGLNPRYDPQGRFPSNLLLSHSLFCIPQGVKRVHSDGHWTHKREIGNGTIYHGGGREEVDFGSIGMEEVEAYECVEGCPVLEIDRQSGIRKSGGGIKVKAGHSIGFLRGEDNYHFRHDSEPCEPSEGGASRYFQQFHYCAKASRSERNQGCEDLLEGQGFDKNTSKQIAHINHATGQTTYNEYQPSSNKNNHPTVKPEKLISWLCTLITPPDGIILDPFGGSGTTGVSAVKNGFHFILIEQEQDYVNIANARIQHALREVNA